MSIDLTFYLGFAIELPYEDDYWDIEEEHPEYNSYDSDVHLIVDGMCGQYTYLMYILDKAEQDDMYDSDYCHKSFNPVLTDEIVEELKKAYTIFTGKELDTNQIKLTRLFHCS